MVFDFPCYGPIGTTWLPILGIRTTFLSRVNGWGSKYSLKLSGKLFMNVSQLIQIKFHWLMLSWLSSTCFCHVFAIFVSVTVTHVVLNFFITIICLLYWSLLSSFVDFFGHSFSIQTQITAEKNVNTKDAVLSTAGDTCMICMKVLFYISIKLWNDDIQVMQLVTHAVHLEKSNVLEKEILIAKFFEKKKIKRKLE